MAKREAVEIQDGVAWTKAQREFVWSTRGQVNPQHVPWILEHNLGDRHPFPFVASTSLVQARDRIIWPERLAEKVKRTQMDAARVDRAQQAVQVPAPTSPLDLELEVDQVCLGLMSVWSAVPWWIAQEGLVFSLRALIAAHQLGFKATQVLGVYDAATTWRLLRGLFAEATDPDYAAGIDVAAAVFDSAEPPLQCALAFTFPTQTEWGQRAAAAVCDRVDATDVAWGNASDMAMVVCDVRLATRLARAPLHRGWAGAADRQTLATLLAHLGAAAGEVLVVALEHAANADTRRVYLEALSQVLTESAMRGALSTLATKSLRPLWKKWVQRCPDVARVVLADRSDASDLLALLD